MESYHCLSSYQYFTIIYVNMHKTLYGGQYNVYIIIVTSQYKAQTNDAENNTINESLLEGETVMEVKLNPSILLNVENS